MMVTAVGMKTEWGKLMETLSEGGEDETLLQVKLNGVATLITAPEGSAQAVKLSLAFAMKKLMEERALVRHLAACETMGSATCICTDKTGTLTTNHMIVSRAWVCEKFMENKDHGSVHKLKSDISEHVLAIFLQSIFHNTSCEVTKDKDGRPSIVGGTPTESALLEFGIHLSGGFNVQRIEYKILKVEPFNSVRKKMSVLVALPNGGVRGFVKGASEIVLSMCDKFIDSNGESIDLTEEKVKNATNVINSFANEASRTLCLAFKDIDDTGDKSIPDDGYTLLAVVGIKNLVRPGVKEAVKTCLAAGITVRMVTGDNINTAKAIARECGILTDDGLAIEGPNFRNLSPEQMKEVIPKLQVMARSLPQDKYTLAKNLREMFGEVVAVTGDGIDDASTLDESDIGLTMGIAGTQVAKERANVIIMNDNFSTIVNAVRWGRAVNLNLQKFVQFQLTVSIVALVINFLSVCLTGSSPVTPVQLLWVNLIKDTLGALALATEPPNFGVMQRPPIPKGANIITEDMWRNIIGQSIYQLAVLVSLNFHGKQFLGLGGADSTKILNTLVFNSFVFCQVFNGINCREIEKINVFRWMLMNWIFVFVMVSTVAFQIIIVQVLGAFASVVALSWKLWGLSVFIGFGSMLVALALKFDPPNKERANTTPHGPHLV